MFERYTEKARRVIFFARYEASQFGTRYIETEHLLLGLIRQDGRLVEELRKGHISVESFRAQVEAETPAHVKISTSVDLPLSNDCKRALAYAAEEMERSGQRFIGTGHLVLGLLRIETSAASRFLEKSGIRLNPYREVVRKITAEEQGHSPEPAPEAVAPLEPRPPGAAALAEPIAALDRLVGLSIRHLDPDQRLKRKPWSRKEAIGHLVDLASTHQRWLARALTEPNVIASGYPEDDWVTGQQYAGYSWPRLVDLWIAMNGLLAHVLSVVPEEKLKLECRIGVEAPQTLLGVIQRYVRECEDVVGQVLARLD